MSHSLLGKAVDDVLAQFWGPHEGRNYFTTTVVPQLRIQVFGSDPATSVVVEENTTLEFRGSNNSNAIGSFPVRGAKLFPTTNPADWTIIGGPVLVASGLVVVALTARPDPYGIRVRVSATGGDPVVGSVVVATEWN